MHGKMNIFKMHHFLVFVWLLSGYKLNSWEIIHVHYLLPFYLSHSDFTFP